MAFTISYVFNNTQGKNPYPQFIGPDSANPASIEAGAEATLNFWADGAFCKVPTLKTRITVTGATKGTWTKNEAGTLGSLVISGATANVVITIKVDFSVTPSEGVGPFITPHNTPIDPRIVLTKNQMVNVDDSAQPTVYYALCTDDQKIYMYNKNNTTNAETGKFKPIEEFLTFDTEEAKTKINTVIADSETVQALDTRVTAIETTLTEPIELFGGNASGWTEG